MKKNSVKYDTLGYRLFVGAMIIAVLAVLVAGLWLGGSPAQERARRVDAARVSDFQSISNAIDQYYTANSNLPPDLDTLARARETYWVSSLVDPDSGEPYEYRIGSGSTYELCSDFSTDSVNVD
ncbi:MAG: hypothetical protein NUW08_03195, partial [Candidatus Uhrbacteria bacterium]|nr:hypothetical protein [Candidatus Uhrbacteria bacterium]